MFSRRIFISSSVAAGAGLALAPLVEPISNFVFPSAFAQSKNPKMYKVPFISGMGGAPLGNNNVAISDEQAIKAVEASWNAGNRFFDTSPFYGYGLSEHRFGAFLHTRPRRDYVLSTKIGRVFKAGKRKSETQNWKNPSPFDYVYDYTADGTRRSIEDSLQRLGIESVDIAFVHDLAPSNGDLGPKWKDQFEIAKNGAFKELEKMKKEGLIKAWGLGVNDAEPIMAALEVSSPDVILAATQYSLITHEEALNKTFPACQAKNVSIVVGSPLNNGFISGADRYDYAGKIPKGAKEKRSKMVQIAKKHGIELRTAALQFCAAHPVVTAVIPGARSPEQSSQNHESMKVKIPAEFWKELKSQGLIAENAPVPGDKEANRMLSMVE